MGSPINPKYPLFLRELNKNKVNNEENNIVGGGYPVVTVENNFNIEAKPNTFYNIKNNADSEINIDFKQEEFYATGKNNKHIMFTWDNIDLGDIMSMITSGIGGIVVQDNSIEGYKYRIDIDSLFLGLGVIQVYLSDNITEGASIRAYNYLLGTKLELNNIHIINKDIDYLYYATFTNESIVYNIPLVVLEEVENDSEFNYKYKYYSILNIMGSSEYLYSNEPINTATSIFIYGEESYNEFVINKVLNKDIEPNNIVNEFLFNINSPANIIFNEEIKWNNDTTPDLTQTGIYTISILDGIGCYTFVNN